IRRPSRSPTTIPFAETPSGVSLIETCSRPVRCVHSQTMLRGISVPLTGATAAVVRRNASRHRLHRRVLGEVEEWEEEFRLLRPGDGVAAVEDEAGDARDAEAAGAAVLGENLGKRGVAGKPG